MGKAGLMALTIAAVVVVVVGASVTAALLRHDAAAGAGGGHGHGAQAESGTGGGHGHGAQAEGMKTHEKGMETDEHKTSGHPAGDGGEAKDQLAAPAHAHGGVDGEAKPQSVQERALPSTAPSAAEMIEPLLSGSRGTTNSGAGVSPQQQQQQSPPATKQPEKSHSDGHTH